MTESFDAEHSSTRTALRDLPLDASAAARIAVAEPSPVRPAPLDMGDSATTDQRVQLTTRYVTHNGEPWIPVMGEYHFSRDLPERWERELRKMKAGGINVLATYMLWIVHEEVEGEIRWDGFRDIRRFVALADEVGLKVMLRIGPWAHGETRNGGFPDWLQALPIQHRSDDPGYLDHVRRWYASIEEQVRGLFHSEENPGGPIIGIQVDNELYDNGPHLATLRDLAESVGMRAALWTATGWGGAQLPARRVLPVYAGYSDGFWEESDSGWPDFGIMHFTFNRVRDDLTVGADLRSQPVSIADDANLGADDPWPFVTCELGGGMAIAYHRRPLVDPDDVAALALTKVGSGSAWQGYYMYHGGTHVAGQSSSTQESHATGYPNDMPERDYDFYAPLGAAGGQRPHFGKLRMQHLALDAFGNALAPTETSIPPEWPGAPRWAVRSDGNRGFLFINNHQPAITALPDVANAQFTVDFPGASITLPSVPTAIASGVYVMWPLRQRFGSLTSVTVTAQPITEVVDSDRTVVLFAATDGVPVELQLEGVDPEDIDGADVRVVGDRVVAAPLAAPGIACEVRIGDTTLVFLDRAAAESVWRGDVDGRDTVVVWSGEGWFADGFVAVAGCTDGTLAAFPPFSGAGSRAVDDGTVFTNYEVPAETGRITLAVPAPSTAPTAPIRRGGSSDRLSAPTDVDYLDAAVVEVPVPSEVFDADEVAVLTLDWIGDTVRIYVGDRLIADQFWHGRPLEIDIAPYRDELRTQPLIVKAFAWAPCSGVYVDPRVRPETREPLLEFRSAVASPVTTMTFR